MTHLNSTALYFQAAGTVILPRLKLRRSKEMDPAQKLPAYLKHFKDLKHLKHSTQFP